MVPQLCVPVLHCTPHRVPLSRHMFVVPAGGAAQQMAVHWVPPQVQVFDALHIWPLPQAEVPQSTLTLQLSFTVPHLPVQVVALRVHPHMLAVPPPPQVCGAVQSVFEQQPLLGMQVEPHGLVVPEQA